MTSLGLIVCAAIVGVSVASEAAAAAPGGTPSAVACRDVPEAETHLAVLMSRADVLRVEALRHDQHSSDPTVPSGDGGRVVLGAQPFVTPAWLQQAIGCHLARLAETGAPAGDRSPLDVPGARVS